MKRLLYLSIGILAVIVLAIILTQRRDRSLATSKTVTLTICCAAALKPVIESTSAKYEEATGMRIQAQYGASGTLLSNIKLAKLDDLFLPADESFITKAQEDQLIKADYPLALMTPVLVIPKSNPEHITSLAQVINNKAFTLAYADPETASIGKISRAALQRSDDWERLIPHIVVTLPTVTDVANAVKIGTVDGGIVWDAVARQYPDMTIIHVPTLDQARQHVVIGVLTTSKHAKEADDFAGYLASSDGQAIFRNLGYDAVER